MGGTMNYRIRNWHEFQHFKDRMPPWIKLHKRILDQRDINVISDRSFRVLIGLWLLASEDKKMQGGLPEIADISFRLRMPERDLLKALQELTHFLECDDINAISTRYQVDEPETETETYTETEGETETKTRVRAKASANTTDNFTAFWQAYPRRVAKGAAQTAWKKMNCDKIPLQTFLDAIDRAKRSAQWKKDNGQFIPHPATWLNQRRWEDEPEAAKDIYGKDVENDADYDPFG